MQAIQLHRWLALQMTAWAFVLDEKVALDDSFVL
jgi:hypothetical protein